MAGAGTGKRLAQSKEEKLAIKAKENDEKVKTKVESILKKYGASIRLKSNESNELYWGAQFGVGFFDIHYYKDTKVVKADGDTVTLTKLDSKIKEIKAKAEKIPGNENLSPSKTEMGKMTKVYANKFMEEVKKYPEVKVKSHKYVGAADPKKAYYEISLSTEGGPLKLKVYENGDVIDNNGKDYIGGIYGFLSSVKREHNKKITTSPTTSAVSKTATPKTATPKTATPKAETTPSKELKVEVNKILAAVKRCGYTAEQKKFVPSTDPSKSYYQMKVAGDEYNYEILKIYANGKVVLDDGSQTTASEYVRNLM